jgi:hypothetical protein
MTYVVAKKTMLLEVGNKRTPIWMLGDSNPEGWEDHLRTLLDPRHSHAA